MKTRKKVKACPLCKTLMSDKAWFSACHSCLNRLEKGLKRI